MPKLYIRGGHLYAFLAPKHVFCAPSGGINAQRRCGLLDGLRDGRPDRLYVPF
jgi:hypothetical protein